MKIRVIESVKQSKDCCEYRKENKSVLAGPHCFPSRVDPESRIGMAAWANPRALSATSEPGSP